jgi:catechol 2,3-dioxygenase-like lactoylglutathione lyase family enzyme
MKRPVEKYEGGMHHLAQPTLDPKATLEFYVDIMGAKITHCISSKGWRPGHYDYVHMFLDLGKGDNIATFYYFGVTDAADWPRYGTHHSFGAKDVAELDRWEAWLTSKGYEIVWRTQYEIMTSLYVFDPNGRFFEIAAQHRPLNDIDAEDAELTAQALVLAAEEGATDIAQMWAHKAKLVEEREGSIAAPAVLFPKVDEFAPLLDAAVANGARTYDRGVFSVAEGKGELRLTKPSDLPEAIWWGVGTGGVSGTVTHLDERELVIS